MNYISIVTAQNVTLKIELANIGDRFLAAFLDTLIKIGLLSLIFFAVYLLGKVHDEIPSTIVMIIGFSFLAFYSLFFEYFYKGQTPGKRVMKIKVARPDGEQVTFGNLFLRWLFRIIDFPLTWPAIGISTIVFTKKFQRIGDLVAGTILITTKDRTTLQDTTYTQLENNYNPVFAQANQLSSKDVEVIQKVLRLYVEHDKYELLQVVSEKLKTALDVQPNMDELTFVRTVLKDYNYAGAVSAQRDFMPEL